MSTAIKFLASAKELKHSELYMTVKCVMFTAETANLNGVRCTEDFLDSILVHQSDYVGLPLCADVHALENHRYNDLGHCYDEREDKFHSQIIGSFYSFEKENLPSGEVALIGYARILKRNAEVCRAIGELFALNRLFFSFEIAVGSCRTREEDGTMEIYASNDNVLEGMCVVTNPAYPQAEALELCAEKTTKEGERDVEVNEIEIQAETLINVAEPEVTSTYVAEADNDVVTEGAPISTDDAVVEPAVAEVVAEPEMAEKSEESEEAEDAEETEETAKKKQCCEVEADDVANAEQEAAAPVYAELSDVAKLTELASALKESIENIRQEIAALKESVAENQKTVVSEVVNPFMSNIALPDEKHFTLLDSEEKAAHYSLLEHY